MPDKDDWRRQGQEAYLLGLTFQRKPYTKYRESWDHDHWDFCGQKLAEFAVDGALHEGYATEDNDRWVCPECFEDFRGEFKWQLQ
ncbi:hypothetical protein [Microbulbifer guangxiensis]|uniref:hypothetical protein n=1 Tax=Microbulbifer guangxiensis TaxID=2904249 RepID=UPI001F2F2DF1|nr:hypothetical protein [Microbulbifer guangxiensis]